MVWLDMIRYGSVTYGLVRYGLVRCAWVRLRYFRQDFSNKAYRINKNFKALCFSF